MLLLRSPSHDLIRQIVAANRQAELSYSEVGWTTDSRCPDGFARSLWREVIGQGDSAFEQAKQAVLGYQMLQLGWVQHVGSVEPVAVGAVVCVLARRFGVYALNVAKVVAVDDQDSTRFGFSYGTTPEYPFVGEERFTVSLDEQSGEVSFEIFSFSRPSSLLMHLALPMLRRVQRQFCRDATAAMRAACR